jgi:hypothetical protein
VGLVVGALLSTLIAWLLESQTEIARKIVPAAIHGVSIGLTQWLVLRRQIRQAGWWIVASILGWGLGLALVESLIKIIDWPFGSVVGWSMAGMVIGTMQWLVLHRQVPRARWWILANTVGWIVSWAMSLVGNGIVGLIILAATGGAVTGLSLTWMLRYS